MKSDEFLEMVQFYIYIYIFFFFEREFQPMASVLDNSSLLSDQDTNQFWCRRGLNPISLIQPSETLLVELTGTHVQFHISLEGFQLLSQRSYYIL